MRSKLNLLLVVLVGLLLVVSFGCPKKTEEKGYEIEVEEGGGTVAPVTPVEKITEPTTVMETMSIITTETAVKQVVECFDASIALLGYPENDYLVQQLLVKSSTLLSGLVNAFTGSNRTIIENALADTETYVSRLDAETALGTGEVDTMKTTLKKHRNNLNGLITTTTVVINKDKKLKDFYTEEELELMKKKWKEYGDNLKRRYEEEKNK